MMSLYFTICQKVCLFLRAFEKKIQDGFCASWILKTHGFYKRKMNFSSYDGFPLMEESTNDGSYVSPMDSHTWSTNGSFSRIHDFHQTSFQMRLPVSAEGSFLVGCVFHPPTCYDQNCSSSFTRKTCHPKHSWMLINKAQPRIFAVSQTQILRHWFFKSTKGYESWQPKECLAFSISSFCP